MNLLSKIFISATCSFVGAIMVSAAPQITVRNVNTDLDTTHIIVPESFELDVHEIMKNWYLTRYTIMDYEADSRPSVSFSDRDYIERLQKLPTHIELPYNSIVGSFIRMYVERKKGLVESMLGLSLYYMPIFDDTFDRYGMPMELRYLAIIESALNPNAVSKAGATGLWQFMASTAQGEGLEVNTIVDERRDPHKSTEAAARYLKKLYDTYGDWSLAIAAYNCGPGNVNKALRRAGGGKKDFWEIYNYLPAETRTYIPAFIAANYVMNYYKDHNISPVLASKPIVVDSIKVNKRVHFQQISDILGIPMEEIRALNPQYRADIIPGDIKPYSLVLPHIQTLCYVAYEDSIVAHDADLYARRDVVEPGVIRKVTDSNGEEFVEVTTVKYHKVKPKETIGMIANRYGVAQSEVVRANGGSRKLRRGKTLQINVLERRPVNSTDSVGTDVSTTTAKPAMAFNNVSSGGTDVPETAEPDIQQADTTASVQVASAMNNTTEQPAQKTGATPQSRPKATTPTTTTHVVKKGDTLFKLANTYGVTVDAIKQANNLKNDNIPLGGKLKIPAKGSTASKGSRTSSRRNSGRRRR